MRKLPTAQDQPKDGPNEHAAYTGMGISRRVRVKGKEGIDATVVVTVVQGKLWMSISPPFTWEAIIEPSKVDDVMHVLEVAREEAKKMAAARSGRAPREGKTVVRAITRGRV